MTYDGMTRCSAQAIDLLSLLLLLLFVLMMMLEFVILIGFFVLFGFPFRKWEMNVVMCDVWT